MTNFAILGGGASGLAGAISLGRELEGSGLDYQITVYEKLSTPAKKILVTGNGRCNLSNKDVDISRYNGDSPLLSYVLNQFTTEDCIDFFHSLGLLLREEDGRLYPYSLHASSVRDVLLAECQRLSITIQTDSPLQTLAYKDGSFIINGMDTADYVLFALGGKAAAAQGTDGDGYRILKSLGIRYAPISPALVQLKTGHPEDLAAVKRLKGTRARVRISLHEENGKLAGVEDGEILFTDYGISGIATMQLSSDANTMNKPYLTIDFCPDLRDIDVYQYLKDCRQMRPGCPAEDLLIGLVHRKIAREILKRADPNDLASIAEQVKAFRLDITGNRGFKEAQVTRGGVPAEELKNHSLESAKVPGLFFSGEILNADGMCGGYNLHFAWGSGILAGKEMARKCFESIS